MYKFLNIFLFIIVITLSMIDYIKLNSIVYLFIIVAFFYVFSRGQECLKDINTKKDLFKLLICEYTGIIYILVGAIIWYTFNLNPSNIFAVICAIPGLFIMIVPYLKNVYWNKH